MLQQFIIQRQLLLLKKTIMIMIHILQFMSWLDFLGPIITFPIFAVIAFILNLLVLVILDKRNRDVGLFESKIFDYILANSVFICIECLLYQLKFLTICISPGAISCSSVRASEVVKFIGIYVIGYLGETIKTCSVNASSCSSVQRYAETSKTENKLMCLFTSF